MIGAIAAGPPAPASGDALARIRACEPIRERPSLHGGTVHAARLPLHWRAAQRRRTVRTDLPRRRRLSALRSQRARGRRSR
jgi:hypothetical protein